MLHTVCINFSSFLDETICSVPDIEELPNPDLTEVPSFLGQNYENRDYARVPRSHNKSKSSLHRFTMQKSHVLNVYKSSIICEFIHY